jgi:hypothetical protein
MNTLKIQIPNVRASIKESVETTVKEGGFSSLQEFTRFLYSQISKYPGNFTNIIRAAVEEEEVLSPQADARYNKMIEELEEDIKNGKSKAYLSVDEMITDIKKSVK